MRFVYVAKHGSGGNDDEGAIAYALEQLGHRVTCIHEKDGNNAQKARGDVLLFHKWHDLQTLARLKNRILKVFWYFDLVDFTGDRSIYQRCLTRMNWMRDMLHHIDFGFCTDGDWVNKDRSNKLIRLTQGADERKIGFVDPPIGDKPIPILFTGTQKGGVGRFSFVGLLRMKYGSRFHHVENGIHGNELAKLIGKSLIVVAPDSPVTDNYWSNRVYLTLGYGGFLIHPRARTLHSQYEDGKHLVLYDNRENLVELIDEYLCTYREKDRRRIASEGMIYTAKTHTYRHRLELMCTLLEERLWQQK